MKLLCCCLILLALVACAPDKAPEVSQDKSLDEAVNVAANEPGEVAQYTRPVGPTSGGYFVVKSTDGRTAELDIYDRQPDGKLLARSRDGQKYDFLETLLTPESIRQLHEFKTQEAMLSVRMKELTSHTSGATTQRATYAHGDSSSFSSVSSGEGSSSASHVVLVSTTSPFTREIVVETFYTDTRGSARLSKQTKTFEIHREMPIEFTIASSSPYASLLQPTVIVRDKHGHILDFETKNTKLTNELKTQR